MRNHAWQIAGVSSALLLGCWLVWLAIQSPLAYEAAYYLPAKPSYLPGETMVFTPSLRVQSKNGTIGITATVWDETRNKPARKCDTTRWMVDIPVYDPPFHVRGTWRTSPGALVIAPVAAGRYIYRITAEQVLRRASSFEVHFAVTHPPGYVC
jgi:hypothetical protein